MANGGCWVCGHDLEHNCVGKPPGEDLLNWIDGMGCIEDDCDGTMSWLTDEALDARAKAEFEDTPLADHLDQLKESQEAFFAALKVPEGLFDAVVDNREFRWNGDHGVTWWKDADDKSHEVRFKRYHDRDGLFICHGKSGDRWAWFVFSTDRTDESLEW